MKQTSFIDAPTKAPWSCPTCCGSKKKSGRCKPCYVEPPKPGGRTWGLWTRGILRIVRARLAHLPEVVIANAWEALLLDSRPSEDPVAVLRAFLVQRVHVLERLRRVPVR